MKPIFYVATPYTHPNKEVMRLRRDLVTEYCARQSRKGFVIFSPITHSHEIALYGTPTSWGFWQQIDKEFLRVCDYMVVLTLPGWKDSIGVTAERDHCDDAGIPVFYTKWEEDLDEVLPLAIHKDATVEVPKE